MAKIGTLNFNLNDGLNSGVALLLTKPPEQEINFSYCDSHILAAPDTPYIICRFDNSHSHEEAYNRGIKSIQEALDLLSITGQCDLATRDSEEEYFVWWIESFTRKISITTTVKYQIKFGRINVIVRDETGTAIPSTTPVPNHHIGFRFFRLSQASDNLFDAYRNMYLAFESLLSSRYPKGRGTEIEWLRLSLESAATDLTLSNIAPTEVENTIEYILEKVYNGARLPLFHAKDGKAYFAPEKNTTDRTTVIDAMVILTTIVIRMAHTWHSARRAHGVVNLRLIKEQYQTVFSNSLFVLSSNPNATLQDDINSETIGNGIKFPATFKRESKNIEEPNITGELDITSQKDSCITHAIYLVNDKSPLMGFTPDAMLDLAGFNKLQVRAFIKTSNARAPKYTYSR